MPIKSNNQTNSTEQMNSLEQVKGVQVLLDNQKNQFELLLSAASLARNLDAVLQGLFIEEKNLISAADLPLSREVSLWSAEERHITATSMRRTLRAHATHQQRELEKAAIEEKIDCTFEIIRDEKASWIKDNLHTSEILFIGSHVVGGHDVKPKSFESLKYCSEVTPPLLAIFDGSESSKKALEVAFQLAEKNNKPLNILLLAGMAAAEELESQIAAQYPKQTNIELHIESISKDYLVSALRRQPINMLIIPSEIAWKQDDGQIKKLTQQVKCPIVLVR